LQGFSVKFLYIFLKTALVSTLVALLINVAINHFISHAAFHPSGAQLLLENRVNQIRQTIAEKLLTDQARQNSLI